ncbi:MAG: adenylate/guanylate cyclase domain-containing protein [Dehalococcoidia bacterium]|nr:adenylate/guanylate cyclase domain-containing protein [Dehalococcoidia bacterium]
MEQQIRFCTTSDGVHIAYATVGQGPPLVVISGWVSHLKLALDDPFYRSFWEGLGEGRTLVRYDKRGTGLSDWDAQDYSTEARQRDLEAVVDALNIERFALMGYSEGGPTAIVYAARHPEKVSHLILYGSYHRWPHPEEVVKPLRDLVRAQWGMGSAALASVFVPSGDPAAIAWFTELERVSASAETAAKILEGNMDIDTTPFLKDVRAPTLIVHRRGDNIAPFEVAREMAALLPDARLEPLEGNDHLPHLGDQRAVLDAIDLFLATQKALDTPTAPSGLLTILFTDMEGSTTLTQRLGDAAAQELLRTHNAIIRDALRAHGGAEIKHTGDGVMASFSTASKALECAVAIQQAFRERNAAVGAALAPPQGAASGAPTPLEPLLVRIGLNAGEPVAEDQDLFGAAVQLAARVCARAEPGQVLAANVVRELAMGKGFLFADMGEVVLRGFEDPVRLYEVRGPDA